MSTHIPSTAGLVMPSIVYFVTIQWPYHVGGVSQVMHDRQHTRVESCGRLSSIGTGMEGGRVIARDREE